MHIREIGDSPEASEIPTSPDQLLGEIGLDSQVVREILDDVSSEPVLDLRSQD